MEGAEWEGAEMEGAEMQGAEMQGAEMQGAEMEDAEMEEADADSESVLPDWIDQPCTVKVNSDAPHTSSAQFLAEAYGLLLEASTEESMEMQRQELALWEGKPKELMRTVTDKILKTLPRPGEWYLDSESRKWRSVPRYETEASLPKPPRKVAQTKPKKLTQAEASMLNPDDLATLTAKGPDAKNLVNIHKHIRSIYTNDLAGKLEELAIRCDIDPDELPRYESSSTRINPNIVKLDRLIKTAKVQTAKAPRPFFVYDQDKDKDSDDDQRIDWFPRASGETERERAGEEDRCLSDLQLALERTVVIGKIVEGFSKFKEKYKDQLSLNNAYASELSQNVEMEDILATAKDMERLKKIALAALVKGRPHLKEACGIIKDMKSSTYTFNPARKLKTPTTTLGFLLNESGILNKEPGDKFCRPR